MQQPISLQALAEQIGAELNLSAAASEQDLVYSIAPLTDASDGQISFLSNSKYRSQLKDTTAMAVIVHPDDQADCPCTTLVHDNPYVAFAYAAQALDSTPAIATDIASSAVIAEDVALGERVKIGANAVVESGAVLGDDVQIGPGCFVGQRARIGKNSKLWANVSVYHEVVIGENCLVQANTVIGSDGFGYANDKGAWIKIPQLGTVIIGDSVEIGASTTIDRGALGDTVLANNCIIDNQVQLAHNVSLGEGTAIAACSVIAGSTRVGKYCSLAGLVGVNGHINICDGVVFTGMSMVTKDIKQPGVYSSGMPAAPNKEWRKNAVMLRNLGDLSQRVKDLERKQSK